jgi:hydroxyethylthiazole kinase-like uncharacterized protein yjeF
VAVVAGSTGMTGAAALCSEAALRSGAGKVVLGIPENLSQTMARKLTEVMTRPLAANPDGTLNMEAKRQIEQLMNWGDAFLFGPGLSQSKDTVRLVRTICGILRKPTVLDADALNALADSTDVLKHIKVEVVTTPHIGEFARMIKHSVKEVLADRITLVRRFVKEHRVVVVLKGHPTVICDKNGDIYINSTGNAGMATAGAGDVLAGIIAGLMAQKLKALPAALTGVYIHGRAGDLAKAKKGEQGMIAGDILTMVPQAFRQLQGGKHV